MDNGHGRGCDGHGQGGGLRQTKPFLESLEYLEYVEYLEYFKYHQQYLEYLELGQFHNFCDVTDIKLGQKSAYLRPKNDCNFRARVSEGSNRKSPLKASPPVCD